MKLRNVLVGTCLVLAACASDATSPASQQPSMGQAGGPSSTPAPEATAMDTNTAAPASATMTTPTQAAGAPAASAGQSAAAEPAASSATTPNGALPTLDPKTPFKDLPQECKGFEVLGLKESPGGTTLPNKCAPFDGTYNNPYAIRCVEADPNYKTAYPGDGYCVLPPPAALGTQIHVGPKDYDDPGTFLLAPGNEENTNYYINSSNAEDHYYYRVNWRMRPGSHHMIVTVSDTDHADGWAADLAGAGAQARNVGVSAFNPSAGSRSFGGSQRPDQDRPQGTLEVPPENQGIGMLLKANQQFTFNLHHINTTETPELREVWVNVWYMNKEDVTKEMHSLAASGSPFDVAIPAHQRTVLKYRCDVQGPARIITMNGHRHAHTDRFSVWIDKPSGEEIRAYESFNWEDMPTFQYDSLSMNPVPNVDKKVDGGSSGELMVDQGDQLYFLCDINNTLDVPLKFANEAIDGEMCILFGTYIGDTSPCSAGAQRLMDTGE